MTQRRGTAARKGPTRIQWKAVFKSQEVDILCVGLFCVLALLAWFVYLQFTDAARGGSLMAVVTTHVSLGRAAGVSMATGMSFSRLETIVLGSLIEGGIVCTLFSAFCLSCKKLIRVPWLDGAMRGVRVSARRQRRHLLGWGIPGLILFVWFPFLMTGPVVGSVIGYLIGMRPWVVVSTVMFGTISAIVSWTFLMHLLEGWMSRVNAYAPGVFVALLLAVVLFLRWRALRRARRGVAQRTVAQGSAHGAENDGRG